MKKLLIILLLSSIAFSQEICKTNYSKLCFTSGEDSFCYDQNNTIIDLSNQKDIKNRIFLIQNKIRETLNNPSTKNLILLSNGFNGTLLFIAQHNLLPYYRKQIKGLVLKKPSSNLYYECKKNRNIENNTTCSIIDEFYSTLNKKVSKDELLKSLSPALQMDWYESKVVVIDIKSREERARWKKSFSQNSINYLIFIKNKKVNLKKWFPIKKSFKVQHKKKVQLKPNYFGSILTFHLEKILYKNHHTLIAQHNISYGEDILQSYDIYYDKNTTQKKPLLIYVHGGGWKGGDKESFFSLAQSYADRGYVAISLNYRLLDIPNITIEMMIEDVKIALEKILSKHKEYHFNLKRVTVMGDSSGSQLLFMAITKLSSKNAIQKAIYNTIPSNLLLYSSEKRETLTGERDRIKQEKILKAISPLYSLMDYYPQTLIFQSLEDKVIKAEHLESLEIQSVINYNNIQSLWIEHGVHPTSPYNESLQPNYSDLSKAIEKFLDKD